MVEGNLGPLAIPETPEAEAFDLTEPDVFTGIDPSEVAAASAAGVEASPKVADEALNGAQIKSLIEIAEKVASSVITREAGMAIIAAAFPGQAGNAEALVGPPPTAATATPAAGPTGAPALEGEADAGEIRQRLPGEVPPGETPQSAVAIGERLGVSAAVIMGLAKRGLIGGWKIGSGWRFLASEVQAQAHRPIPTDVDPDDQDLDDGEEA